MKLVGRILIALVVAVVLAFIYVMAVEIVIGPV